MFEWGRQPRALQLSAPATIGAADGSFRHEKRSYQNEKYSNIFFSEFYKFFTELNKKKFGFKADPQIEPGFAFQTRLSCEHHEPAPSRNLGSASCVHQGFGI